MAEFMTGLKRTHYCGELRSTDIGKEVVVCGWVQRQRDLGQLIFIDLRDRTGIVQLAFDESTDRAIFEKAFAARAEFVLLARGTVRERTSKNPDLPTGDIELEVLEPVSYTHLDVMVITEFEGQGQALDEAFGTSSASEGQ